MFKKLSRLIIPILLLVLAFSATPALACSPSEDALNYTIEDRVENAPIIFIGTIIDGSVRGGSGYEVFDQVDVDVEHFLKGEGPEIVRITGYGDGADCLSVVDIGQRSIFFASGDADGILEAQYLGVHDATAQVSDENIMTVTTLTRQFEEPYPLPFSAQLSRFMEQYGLWLIGAIAILVAIVGIAFVMKPSNDEPKAKTKRS